MTLLETMVDGRKALVVTDDIPDDAPAVVREGIARRRLVWTGGACPCGATMPQLNREQRRKLKKGRGRLRVQIRHEPGCPAVHPLLTGRAQP